MKNRGKKMKHMEKMMKHRGNNIEYKVQVRQVRLKDFDPSTQGTTTGHYNGEYNGKQNGKTKNEKNIEKSYL